MTATMLPNSDTSGGGQDPHNHAQPRQNMTVPEFITQFVFGLFFFNTLVQLLALTRSHNRTLATKRFVASLAGSVTSIVGIALLIGILALAGTDTAEPSYRVPIDPTAGPVVVEDDGGVPETSVPSQAPIEVDPALRQHYAECADRIKEVGLISASANAEQVVQQFMDMTDLGINGNDARYVYCAYTERGVLGEAQLEAMTGTITVTDDHPVDVQVVTQGNGTLELAYRDSWQDDTGSHLSDTLQHTYVFVPSPDNDSKGYWFISN